MDFDPTEIAVADVYKGDILAGSLRRDRDDVVFSYTDDYLGSPLPAVATTLPKTANPTRTRAGAVPAFFAGLLPEGRRLQSMQSSLKTSRDDELSQLLAVGADCVGDVRVVPEGMPLPAATASTRELDDPGQISLRELFEQSLGRPFAGPSVPGVQDKLSDAMLSLPTRHRGEAVILKLSPSGYPQLVENESLFLGWASFCGLDVPAHSVITDRDGSTGLVVTRFDRQREKGGTIRIAQEDAVQAANRWPAAKYLLSAREVFTAVTQATPAAQVAASRLLRLFAFSYAIANGDLHAKNVSIYHRDGAWAVTPAYDLVSTLPYGDAEMALELEGRKSRITGSTFIEFAARFAVTAKAARRVLDDVADRVESRLDDVATIGLSERKTAHLSTTIATRIAELRR